MNGATIILLLIIIVLAAVLLAMFRELKKRGRLLREQVATMRDESRALRKSEERLKEAQQIASLGNWELDLRTGRLIWSDSIFQMFEIDPDVFEASYQAFLAAVHPDDRRMIDDAYAESLQTRQPYEISHRLLMKDGRVKWVHEICRTEYDNDGNAVKSTGVVQDITKSKEAEEKIRHMANHDYLTELPTMRLARDRLTMAINAARRYNEMVAVLFIDLDGFKAINDTHGHDVGDHVLKQVAKHLVTGVRATSTVARAGGDEFLVIATELRSRDAAALIAEKVLRLVSLPVSLYDKEAVLTSSVGISLFPADGDDLDALIKLADSAMYRAKKRGKNCYCFAGTD